MKLSCARVWALALPALASAAAASGDPASSLRGVVGGRGLYEGESSEDYQGPAGEREAGGLEDTAVPTRMGEMVAAEISQADLGAGGTYELSDPAAAWLSVRFAALSLAGCVLTVSSPDGRVVQTVLHPGSADPIEGSAVVVSLSGCREGGEEAVFTIDGYARGDPPSVDGASLCGDDNKQNAFCYKTGEHAAKYERARAVARVRLNGNAGSCTGWLVGPDLLLTNNHCLQTTAQLANTKFEFMAEEQACNGFVQDGNFRVLGPMFDGVQVLKTNYENDYTLVRLAQSVGYTYGYFEFEDRVPQVGEEIYVPQHPQGRPKEIGVFDTNEGGGKCVIKRNLNTSCHGGPQGITYTCDTQKGSSGSPVVSAATHKILGLHNCGGKCLGNWGVTATAFLDDIREFLPAPGAPLTPPPTQAPCAGDSDALLTVEVTTDRYPIDFPAEAWTLKDTCDGYKKVQSQPNTAYDEKETVYTNVYCVPKSRYEFKIFDTYGDGLCCRYGEGGYKLTYDGEEEEGGQFTEVGTSVFGACALAEPTTPPPTDAPTSAPSSAPTEDPTGAPSSAPSSAPTEDPDVIRLDLATIRIEFSPEDACADAAAAGDGGRASGASPHECAQACAMLAGCDGFVQLDGGDGGGPGPCLLSGAGAARDCDGSAPNAKYYVREIIGDDM